MRGVRAFLSLGFTPGSISEHREGILVKFSLTGLTAEKVITALVPRRSC